MEATSRQSGHQRHAPLNDVFNVVDKRSLRERFGRLGGQPLADCVQHPSRLLGGRLWPHVGDHFQELLFDLFRGHLRLSGLICGPGQLQLALAAGPQILTPGFRLFQRGRSDAALGQDAGELDQLHGQGYNLPFPLGIVYLVQGPVARSPQLHLERGSRLLTDQRKNLAWFPLFHRDWPV